MDLELRGKSVLITGASKGIGLACAHGFAAEGANVHLAARNTAAMEAAAEEIRKKYKVDATVHTVDLGLTGNAVALGQKCGRVDVLVNNAGAIPAGKPHSDDGREVAQGLGPQGVRLLQLDERDLQAHVRARLGRHRQRDRRGRREPSRELHRRNDVLAS